MVGENFLKPISSDGLPFTTPIVLTRVFRLVVCRLLLLDDPLRLYCLYTYFWNPAGSLRQTSIAAYSPFRLPPPPSAQPEHQNHGATAQAYHTFPHLDVGYHNLRLDSTKNSQLKGLAPKRAAKRKSPEPRVLHLSVCDLAAILPSPSPYHGWCSSRWWVSKLGAFVSDE